MSTETPRPSRARNNADAFNLEPKVVVSSPAPLPAKATEAVVAAPAQSVLVAPKDPEQPSTTRALGAKQSEADAEATTQAEAAAAAHGVAPAAMHGDPEVGVLLEGDLLRDVRTPDPEQLKIKTRLYRCSIKESIKQQMQIGVGGVTFSTQTARLDQNGEYRQVRGSIQRLSDPQVRRMKELLQYQFLRPSVYQENGKDRCVFQHVDCSDGAHPPKILPGRMVGNEIPLRDAIEFELLDGTLRDHSPTAVNAMSKEDRRREREELEREEIEDMQNFERDARAGRLDKHIPTATASTPALAGLIG